MTPHLAARLSELDTARFTINDVARVFDTWRWVARLLVKSAVRRGEFRLVDADHYALSDD